MNRESCYELGYIEKTIGLKGEVQVFLDVDIPDEYSELESVFVEINNKLVPFFIDYVQLKHKSKASIKFEDVNDFEQASSLKGLKLFLPLDFLPKLGDKSFYYHEITDFLIKDKNLGELGRVASVFSGGAQDIIAMDYKGKEVLIPVSDALINKVDREKKVLELDLPNGLIDVYLED